MSITAGFVASGFLIHAGKHFPNAWSNFGESLIRILRRNNAQTKFCSLAKKPNQVLLSALTERLALPM